MGFRSNSTTNISRNSFFLCFVQVATKDGGATGTVVQVSYPTRSDAESAMPPAKKEDAPKGEEAAASLGLEEEKEKEKARKVTTYNSTPLRCGLFCCIVLY